MRHPTAALIATLAALAFSGGALAAQPAAKPAAQPATKPAAPAKKASKPAASKAAAAKPAPEEPLPPAEGEQNAAASMAHFGDYQCEFNQAVHVTMNDKYPGYIDVRFGKSLYTMKPVLSSTGALRMEDVRGQTLMLQIAYKSMLMDVKAGRRLVDECVHEKQAVARKAAENQPAVSLMGGTPAGATAATAAPTSR